MNFSEVKLFKLMHFIDYASSPSRYPLIKFIYVLKKTENDIYVYFMLFGSSSGKTKFEQLTITKDQWNNDHRYRSKYHNYEHTDSTNKMLFNLLFEGQK